MSATNLLMNKVAIVTGGGSGIGRAVAILFAQEGAKVLLSDLNESGCKETMTMIERQGGVAAYMTSDVSQPMASEQLVNQAVEKFGGLNIAVNNAGISGLSAPTAEYTIEAWNQVISTNLSGVFYGMKYQIPAMLKAGGGSIINISSILGQVGFANAPAYTAAKHGVVGLTQNAALEYSSKNIRINSVGPAFIMTPMLEKGLTKEALAGAAALHPIGRLGEASEVAELVLWLASAKSSFVTGSYYPIDGGYLAR